MSHHCFGAGFRAEATGLDWIASSRKYPAAARPRTASLLVIQQGTQIRHQGDIVSQCNRARPHRPIRIGERIQKRRQDLRTLAHA